MPKANWNNIDPYAAIRDFWGEELSSELIQRIAKAPPGHLSEFLNRLLHSDRGIGTLPDLPPGHLRPIVTCSAVDELTGRTSPTDLAVAASTLLLYAHGVVMDDMSHELASPDPAVRARTAETLLAMRPLFDDGAIFFKPVTSAKRHPSTGQVSLAVAEEARSLHFPEVDHFIAMAAGSDWRPSFVYNANFEGAVVENLLHDVYSHFRFAASWPGKVHRLLRSDAERVLMALVIDSVPMASDRRQLTMQQLARIVVPGFRPDLGALVTVRRSGDAFADWRDQLAVALDRVDIDDGADEASLARVRAIISEELTPVRNRLVAASSKSTALASLRSSSKGFGVSAISAVAGLAVGGNVKTALVTAAASKSIETITSYVDARRSQRAGRAVLDLVTSFHGDHAS